MKAAQAQPENTAGDAVDEQVRADDKRDDVSSIPVAPPQGSIETPVGSPKRD